MPTGKRYNILLLDFNTQTTYLIVGLLEEEVIYPVLYGGPEGDRLGTVS